MPPTYSPRVASSHAGVDYSSTFSLREQNLRFILGLKLHHLRQERELSLVQLSKVCGLSVSYLNEIEKGKKYPKTDKLLALARALDVSYNELVSAEPGSRMHGISSLLTTRLPEDLPLTFYGIDPSVLMEIMSTSTERVSALLGFLRDLSTRFDFRADDLIQAAIRHSLEAHGNHFADLEAKAIEFAKSCGWATDRPPTLDELRTRLINDFKWEIDEKRLGMYPDLADVGALPVVRRRRRLLLLHPDLPETRRAYYIAREIAAGVLGLSDGTTAFSESADDGAYLQMLDAARAGYCAGVLLFPAATLGAELREFFARDRWDGESLAALVARHGGDPELLFHRAAQLLPKILGIDSLFIVRTEHEEGHREFAVNRELRIGAVPPVYGAEIGEHRCRRAIAVRLLSEMKGEAAGLRIGAQRERIHGTEQAFLTLAVSFHRPLHRMPASCVTLGLPIDGALRRTVGFVDDPAIPERLVDQTCERCSLAQCEERAAPPVVHLRNDRRAARQTALDGMLRGLDL